MNTTINGFTGVIAMSRIKDAHRDLHWIRSTNGFTLGKYYPFVRNTGNGAIVLNDNGHPRFVMLDGSKSAHIMSRSGEAVGLFFPVDVVKEPYWLDRDSLEVLTLAHSDIYDHMIAFNVPIDNHESDLYVPVTELTEALVNMYMFNSIVSRFTSRLDHTQWFCIPFAYTPFWKARLDAGKIDSNK